MDEALIAAGILAGAVYLFFRGRVAAPLGSLPRPSPVGPARAGSGSDAIDNIGQAIFQHEALNPDYNNPGALKAGTSDWIAPGLATGESSSGFATYADMGDGWDALNGYVVREAAAHPDWNFYDFFQHYLGQVLGGPTVTSQGDSNAYAEGVAGFMGVDPTDSVAQTLGVG